MPALQPTCSMTALAEPRRRRHGSPRVELFVRLFPCPDRDYHIYQVSSDSKVLMIKRQRRTNKEEEYSYFETSGVLDGQCQEGVYAALGDDIFPRLFRGENFIIMAMGQRNSGKSFTMTGIKGTYEIRGLVLRMLSELYQQIEILSQVLQVSVSITYLEFAANQVVDLLTEPASLVHGLGRVTPVVVGSLKEAAKAVFEGERRRWTEASSHCGTAVVSLDLECVSLVDSQPYNYYPKLQLVEAAGVSRMREARALACESGANLALAEMSLFFSGAKPSGLGQTAKRLVSFLDRTWHQAHIRLVCHVRPTQADRRQSMSTMCLGKRLQRSAWGLVAAHTRLNSDLALNQCLAKVKQLEDEILLSGMMGESGYRGDIGKAELDHVLALTQQYLQDELPLNTLLLAASPLVLLTAVKKAYNLEQDSEEVIDRSQRADTDQFQLQRKVSMTRRRSNRSNRSALSSRATSSRLKSHSGVSRAASQVRYQPSLITQASLPPSDLEVDPAPLPERHSLWTEFLTRYPEKVHRLSVVQQNYSDTLRVREERYLVLKEKRVEAREARGRLEAATWRRRLAWGEVVGPDGTVLLSREEEEVNLPVFEAAITLARTECHEAAVLHAAAAATLNDVANDIDRDFQEYCETSYGESMPDLNAEKDSKTCWLEVPEAINGRPGQEAFLWTPERTLFYALQSAASGSSHPFQAKKTWK